MTDTLGDALPREMARAIAVKALQQVRRLLPMAVRDPAVVVDMGHIFPALADIRALVPDAGERR